MVEPVSVFTDTFSETMERDVEVSKNGEGVVEAFSSTDMKLTVDVSTELFSVVSIIASLAVLESLISELSVTISCGVVDSVIEGWVAEVD